MLPTIVTYALDDSTKVRFEIDPPAGFQEAGADKEAYSRCPVEVQSDNG